MKTKQLLFSVTASDCEWSYTKGTGAGGQKRNKTSSAVHCHHRPSGAHGYSEASRSQHDNKRDAFIKMSETTEFKHWHQLEVARRTGVLAEIERKVEREMQNVKTEVRVDNRWRAVDPQHLVDDPDTFDVTKLKDE
jgi:protein subunit release factor B